MAATTRSALLWRLLMTLFFLAGWQWSSCVSTAQIRPSYGVSETAPVHRYDGSLESGALRRLAPAALDHGFNLGDASGARRSLLSKESPSRLVLETTPVNEVQVLIAFKAGIKSDPLGVLRAWRANDSDACSWEGVECAPNSTHVTALNLGSLELEGTVSGLLGQLSFLQQLDLSDNNLSGLIPPSLANCSDLSYLNISFNRMKGDIPLQVGQLDKLRTLDLSSNNLTGEIPATLGNCSSLENLNLGTNTFQGGIPPQLGRLSRLQVLSLPSCSISGSVPPELGNCSSLTQLELNFNSNLGGEVLPVQLGELTHLQQLLISTCNFRGEFPAWALNLTNLQDISLLSNEFDGPIPEDIGRRLPNLVNLQLGQNFFTGEIPRSIFNVTGLVSFNVKENQLYGSIPSDVGLLKNLQRFYVFDNAFTGTLPSSLSNCSQLIYFMAGINPFDPQVLPSWIASFRNLHFTYLPRMNLYGEIPAEVGQLSQIVEFLVFENNLTGSVPASIGNCTSLKNFNIRANQLSGELPSELGNLPIWYLQIGSNSFPPGPIPSFVFNLSVVELGMQSNHLTGRLDVYDFGNFDRLQSLAIYYNDFEGPIPESLANCSNMVTLVLAGNRLNGELPPWLANLTNLGDMLLASNQLSGRIPEGILTNFQLSSIDLSLNNFEGALPEDLCYSPSLQLLHLNTNNFTGTIPSSLGNCTEMISLDLSQNSFSGSLPGLAFAQMSSSLSVVDVSDNQLSGQWPSEFSKLINIQSINVSINNLTGSIPQGLGGCVALETLDLSFNQFTGQLPKDLGALRDLVDFNASYNDFEGPIPDSGAFQSNLTAASFLGNPGLCGGVLGPQRQCSVQAPSSPPAGRRSRCKGFKCTHVWVSVLAAAAFLISILAAVLAASLYVGRHGSRRRKPAAFRIDPRMKFSQEDILATIAAGEEHIIGKGAKSTVYKTILRGGETVAIKVLQDLPGRSAEEPESQDEKRWETEISSEARTLAMLRHRNIIKVFGLCSVLDAKAIVLEYMPKGSLYAQLHENGPCKFTWGERFRILLGVTHGMVYLHHEFADPIIHRDLKSSNILLNADLEPKVCDFGISKVVAGDSGETTASTFCGTFGYLPPEYGTGARVSTKGDVYSFGVIVLEILTAKKAIQSDGEGEFGQSENIVNIVEQRFEESESLAFDLLDATLREEGLENPKVREQMMLVLKVGLLCTKILPQTRPSMNAVLEMFQQINEIGEESTKQRSLDDLLRTTYAASSSQSPASIQDLESMTQSY